MPSHSATGSAHSGQHRPGQVLPLQHPACINLRSPPVNFGFTRIPPSAGGAAAGPCHGPCLVAVHSLPACSARRFRLPRTLTARCCSLTRCACDGGITCHGARGWRSVTPGFMDNGWSDVGPCRHADACPGPVAACRGAEGMGSAEQCCGRRIVPEAGPGEAEGMAMKKGIVKIPFGCNT